MSDLERARYDQALKDPIYLRYLRRPGLQPDVLDLPGLLRGLREADQDEDEVFAAIGCFAERYDMEEALAIIGIAKAKAGGERYRLEHIERAVRERRGASDLAHLRPWREGAA